LPLNICAVKRLLSTYQRILSQLKEREDAASNYHDDDSTFVEAHSTSTDISARTDHISASLAATVGDATTSSATNAHRRLPQSRQPVGKRGGA